MCLWGEWLTKGFLPNLCRSCCQRNACLGTSKAINFDTLASFEMILAGFRISPTMDTRCLSSAKVGRQSVAKSVKRAGGAVEDHKAEVGAKHGLTHQQGSGMHGSDFFGALSIGNLDNSSSDPPPPNHVSRRANRPCHSLISYVQQYGGQIKRQKAICDRGFSPEPTNIETVSSNSQI